MMCRQPGTTGPLRFTRVVGACQPHRGVCRVLSTILLQPGTTVTVLRPAGSVLFDELLIDVVSDGGYIPAGVRVQVVLVEGTRIVVKAV